jgi:hypothetical protein
MNNKSQIKVGSKVHYTNHNKIENGIVKDMSEDTPVSVRVVYHWNEDPENYMNYTGALTPLRTLTLGWVDNTIE